MIVVVKNNKANILKIIDDSARFDVVQSAPTVLHLLNVNTRGLLLSSGATLRPMECC